MTEQIQKIQVRLWDRIEGESDMWYHRFFTYYRALPPTKRSITNALKDGSKDGQKGNLSNWTMMANKCNWKERAAAWDDYMRSLVLNSEIEDMGGMLTRHLAAARLLFDKSIHYLSSHDISDERTAVRAMAIAIAEERKVRGLPDYLVEIFEMTDEQLHQRYQAQRFFRC